jgi:hypothetical protein
LLATPFHFMLALMGPVFGPAENSAVRICARAAIKVAFAARRLVKLAPRGLR